MPAKDAKVITLTSRAGEVSHTVSDIEREGDSVWAKVGGREIHGTVAGDFVMSAKWSDGEFARGNPVYALTARLRELELPPIRPSRRRELERAADQVVKKIVNSLGGE